MIGLDSYSRQVFDYLDPILIYISLWIDCLFEIRKIAVCFLWLSLPVHYRVTDEALVSRTYVVWPIFSLMNVFIALKGTHFWFLFAFTVVQCGGRKTSPRISTLVKFIFHFWSFEISVNTQRFISVFESTAYLKFAKLQYVSSGRRYRFITGSLMRL